MAQQRWRCKHNTLSTSKTFPGSHLFVLIFFGFVASRDGVLINDAQDAHKPSSLADGTPTVPRVASCSAATAQHRTGSLGSGHFRLARNAESLLPSREQILSQSWELPPSSFKVANSDHRHKARTTSANVGKYIQLARSGRNLRLIVILHERGPGTPKLKVSSEFCRP